MQAGTHQFTLRNLYGDVVSEGLWSEGGRNSVRVEQEHGRLSVLHHGRAGGDYILHRGRREDLRNLVSTIPPRGSAQTLTIELGVTHRGNATAELDLCVIEYDTSATKIEVTFYEANKLHRHEFSPRCHAYLIGLRLRGQGSVALERLMVQAHDATAAITLLEARELADRIRRFFADRIGATQTQSLSSAGQSDDASTAENRRIGPPRFLHALIAGMAESLPVSNGSRHHVRRPYRVAIVTDVYMYNFFRDAFQHVDYLTPENYERVLAEGCHDFFLYVTCWKGIDNEWQGLKYRPELQQALDRIIQEFRSRGLPTLFQSIEDPSNFDYFLPMAKLFDHVFTSDAECVKRYAAELGHDRVYHGPYGANPLLNNPIGAFRSPIDGALFAGSYPIRYPERCHDMNTIFSSVLESQVDLVIADRNFGNDTYAYPAEYEPLTTAPFSHELLQRVHKLFRYSLNFNSIKLSPTMCAMRVYELQAQGASMISNYARSVFNQFPSIRMVPVQQELRDLRRGVTLREVAERLDGVRAILSSHTTYDVVDAMLGAINLTAHPDSGRVLALSLDGEGREGFDHQTYLDREFRSLTDFSSLADLDRYCTDADISYLALWSRGEAYEPHYLQDRINAFKFTDSDYVTQTVQAADWTPGLQPVHEFVTTLGRPGQTVFSVQQKPASSWVGQREGASIPNGYAVDPLQVDFPAGRRYAPTSTSVKSGGIDPPTQSPRSAGRPALSVIVPVHNNGHHLLSTCLASLERNEIWPAMEVILVDDGSTDLHTAELCRSLERECPNIRLYAFADSGSGSASRPRNKGIELATADLVTFLDPDNEISPGGYDHLLQVYSGLQREGGPKFVSGLQVKVGEKTSIMARHASGITEIADLRGVFFERGKFPLISTQAAVIERALFSDGELRFVEGAVGQDTLFGWEMLLKSQIGCFTDEAHIVYYAGRDGSVTNNVGPSFFRKSLILEAEQVRSLRKHGLLDLYRQNHLTNFVDGWYRPRLARVPKAERAESQSIFEEILRLYEA